MNKHAHRVYRFGDFTIDASERLLRREGEPVLLHPKVLETLLVLVESAGRLVSKEELFERVWGATSVEEGSLAVNISLLRKALGESGKGEGRKYIETTAKRGYRFVAPVVEEAYSQDTQSATPKKISLAVLPFVCAGAEHGDEQLGAGLTEGLTRRLGGTLQLLVRPANSVARYKTQTAQDQLLASKQLGVDAVLRGEVHQENGNLSLKVELRGTRDGVLLWAGDFSADAGDVLRLEESISRRVAQTLMLRLSEEERRQFVKRSTNSVEAYQAYTTSRYYLLQGTPEGFKKSTEWAERAIDADPRYALAHAGLADAYIVYSMVAGESPPTTLMPLAKRAVNRALDLDDSLAEAHELCATINLSFDWDWAEAEKEFKRALELNPNSVMTRFRYALYFLAVKQFDKAIAELKVARSLYPLVDELSLNIELNAGLILYYARRFDDSIGALQPLYDLAPYYFGTSWVLGKCYLQKGDYTKAVEVLQPQAESGNPHCSAVLGCAYAAGGKRAEALEVLSRLGEVSRAAYVSNYFFAELYAGLGETDKAFECLEKAYAERIQFLILLDSDPVFDGLKADPRFREFLRRIKII